MRKSVALCRRLVSLQSEKLVAGNRAVREDVLVGNDCWRSWHRHPTVRGDVVRDGLKREIAVVKWPGEDRVGVDLLNVQGWSPQLKRADVAPIAATRVCDRRKIERPGRAALVSGETETLALIEG